MNAVSSTTSRNTVVIDELSIYLDEQPLHYLADSEALDDVRRGMDQGAILIRLDVDNDHSRVDVNIGQTGQFRALRRAIELLTTVHDQLERMIPEDQRIAGRCMAGGPWGRCKHDDDHDGDHDFPTEDEYNLSRPARLAERASA